MENDFAEAHRLSFRNKIHLEKKTICGCFYCFKILHPSKITEWWDDDDTAVCPYCGIDSVIGESSEFKITEAFLKEMHQRWF
ncbi:cytoplasmic protein [Paenibacillus sp. 102]|uniref:cytoplasmic protein n=1 Tax=Paenibacillus sp. 102 TaxID=3120823 RepID=UPI0031BB7D71